MQAVILTAGKSTRTYPLTVTRPKPLLPIANKPFMSYTLDNLQGIVSEVIMVVGYKKKMIAEAFGKRYKKVTLKYVEQRQQLGTAHALVAARRHIKNRFLLLNGDDWYSKRDMRNCAKHRYALLVARVRDPRNFGVIVEKHNRIVDFVEKPKRFVSNLANMGCYMLDKNIFLYLRNLKKSSRGEIELPDAIKALMRNHTVYCVKTKKWIPLTYPWDLLAIDQAQRDRKNKIGKNVSLKASVTNSSIGNNCIIQGTVKNSIVMENTHIEKKAVVEHSIIGTNAYFKGTTKTKKGATSMVKGKRVTIPNTVGAVIGDTTNLNNVIIKPGVKIWPGKKATNKTITKDLK